MTLISSRTPFRTSTIAASAIAMVLMLGSLPAHAVVTLNYAGNNFTTVSADGPTTPPELYTTADRVAGSIELAAPLAANLVNAII